jgi:hypothetical protein
MNFRKDEHEGFPFSVRSQFGFNLLFIVYVVCRYYIVNLTNFVELFVVPMLPSFVASMTTQRISTLQDNCKSFIRSSFIAVRLVGSRNTTVVVIHDTQ